MSNKRKDQVTKNSNDLETTGKTIEEVESNIPQDTLQEDMDKEFKDDNPIDEKINDAVGYELNRKQREVIASTQSKLRTSVYIEGTADVQEFLDKMKKTIDEWRISSCIDDVETVEEAQCLIQLLKEKIKEIRKQNSYYVWDKIKDWWNNLQ